MALPNPEFKAIERINDLVLQLNEYRNDYYNHSNSLATDEEYDRLFDELKAMLRTSENRLAKFMTGIE